MAARKKAARKRSRIGKPISREHGLAVVTFTGGLIALARLAPILGLQRTAKLLHEAVSALSFDTMEQLRAADGGPKKKRP